MSCENISQSLDKKILEQTLLEFILDKPVSVRLRNVITIAAQKSDPPFKTIGEYLRAGPSAQDAIRELKNAGRKTANEFNQLVYTHYENWFKYDHRLYEEQVHTNKDNNFVDIGLVELISNTYVSARLKNAITTALSDGKLSFRSVADYLNDKKTASKELLTLQNFGRNSLKELDSIVEKYCCQEMDEENDSVISTHEEMLDRISEILTDREFEIFLRRNGLCGLKKETLEKIANDFGVTRERIRQLAKKILQKIWSLDHEKDIKPFLNINKKAIEEALFHPSGFVDKDFALEKFSQVDNLYSTLIEVFFDGILEWLDSNYNKCDRFWILPCVDCDNLPNYELTTFTADWKRIVRKKTESMQWPISIDELSRYFPQFSHKEIEDYFIDELGAVIRQGGIVNHSRISATARIKYVLRFSGRALHTSEIRARHLEMFGIDVQEHNIGARLQGMEDALIVDRGVYDLYENLDLSDEKLGDIRDKVFLYLNTKAEYVSAKVIYRKLFSGDSHKYGINFSSYMLLGILQDDNRFSVRRGLMVAIANSEAEANFISLGEELVRIVENFGPISVSEIKKKIKRTRSVLDVTVTMFLDSSLKVVLSSKPGAYDTVENVIGPSCEVDRLNNAIELCLLDSGRSLYFIANELAQNNIFLQEKTLKSWLSKFDKFSRRGDVFYLEEASDILKIYNESYLDIISGDLPFEKAEAELHRRYKGKPEEQFINLDVRLSSQRKSNSGSDELLDCLLEEFKL